MERDYHGRVHHDKTLSSPCVVCGCARNFRLTLLEAIINYRYQSKYYDEPITKYERELICWMFQSENLDIMKCPNFWNDLSFSRISVLKYLIDMSFINMHDDNHRKRLRDVFIRDVLTADSEYDSGINDEHTISLVESLVQIFKDYGYAEDLLRTFKYSYRDDSAIIFYNVAMSLFDVCKVPDKRLVKLFLNLYREYNIKLTFPFNPQELENKVKVVLKDDKYSYGISVVDTFFTYSLEDSPEWIWEIFENKYLELNIYYYEYIRPDVIILRTPIQKLLKAFARLKDTETSTALADFIEKLIKFGLDPSLQGKEIKLIGERIEVELVTTMDYAKHYGWIYPGSEVQKVLERHFDLSLTDHVFPEIPILGRSNLGKELEKQYRYTKDPEQLKEMAKSIEEITRDDYLYHFRNDQDWLNAPYVGEVLKKKFGQN